MNNLTDLQRLVEAVKEQGANIAPTYNEYYLLAFAIATDCGEAGRRAFHELCAPSPKYRQRDADRMFDAALRNNRGQVHLATAFFLAQNAGVKVKQPEEKEARKCEKMQIHQENAECSRFSHTHARAFNKVDDEMPLEDMQKEQLQTGSDPLVKLPCFEEYAWPGPLAEVRKYGTTPARRDILFLGTLTVLGACLGNRIRSHYGGKYYSPCFQLFVVAPPASGKGMLSFVRKFAEHIHHDIRRQVDQQMKEYRKQRVIYESLGKKRMEQEAPQQPKNRMFIIPGNNSGTGILQNLIDSDGWGIIIEPEADTVSTAIGSDYGHWSDTLRKTFDHDPLSYNRRSNQEYREVERSYLSVILSGTPAQVKPLIPSAENGLFSRQLFYYMPMIKHWENQFDYSEGNVSEAFDRLSHEWKAAFEDLRSHGIFDFELTPAQKEQFNDFFNHLFHSSLQFCGTEMVSTVTRLGIIIYRMMSVVAVLRMTEAGGVANGYALVNPAADTCSDNLKDGIVAHWVLGISDADFNAVLSLTKVLYAHAQHILSFLPTAEITRRVKSECFLFFKQLPQQFSRQLMLEKAEQMNLNRNTALSWLNRARQLGWVKRDGNSGMYTNNIL